MSAHLTLLLIRVVELVALTAVCLVLARRIRRLPSRPAAWAATLFGVLTVLTALGFLPEPEGPGSTAAILLSKVFIGVLLTVPYLLVGLARALGATGRAATIAGALLAGELLVTAVVPPLPPPDVPRPTWVLAYTAFVLLAWSVQSVLAARDFWSAGRGRSAVLRHRLHALAYGSILLAVDLLIAGAVGGDADREGMDVLIGLAGLGAVLLLALAFLVPAPLRLLWRQQDEAELAVAERTLMTATSPHAVAEAIVPALAGVLGGDGAALLNPDGVVLAVQGLSAQQLSAAQSGAHPSVPELFCLELSGGRLIVGSGPAAPLFGSEEEALLRRVGNLVDLALERIALFTAERASREQAQRAGAELQTLLYSVSHDLRSPLISVLGYLDYLIQDHGDALPTEGLHFLDRIRVNAHYMQDLINDLLELSRIGRVDPPATDVDLVAVGLAVADGIALIAPTVTVVVDPALPRLHANETRVRQLLTNLVENAVRHGGRDDLVVRLDGQRTADGDLELDISDDGRGVPEAYRERVFEVFERLDAAPRGTAGTGMGLTICRRIVETLGGTVCVQGARQTPTGTTVRMVLPAALVRAPTVPPVHAVAPHLPSQPERTTRPAPPSPGAAPPPAGTAPSPPGTGSTTPTTAPTEGVLR